MISYSAPLDWGSFSHNRKEYKMTWYNATKKDSWQGLVYDETTGENIAVTYNPDNARLVAAAPDLLAALEGILERVNVRIDDPRIEQFDAARAAVAKALNT
jgi:hypothetical protein